MTLLKLTRTSAVLLLLLPVCFRCTGGDALTNAPRAVNAPENILMNSSFTQTRSCDETRMKYFQSKKLLLKNRKLPAGFMLAAPGASVCTEGSAALAPLPDGNGNFFSFRTRRNKYNAVALQTEAPVKLEDTQGKELFCGFWGRGEGTMSVKFLRPGKNGPQEAHVERFLLTSAWHPYRFPVPGKLRKKGKYHLSFSVYGNGDLAFPEVAPLPAVDPSAELLFYAPFENGSPEALFSLGATASYGNPELPKVPGISGNAVRLDRLRRLGTNGMLRYPMGFGYEFPGRALDCRRGTIAFFFRPLKEMLEPQQWEGFPLFFLGDTTWQWKNAQDFSLMIQKEGETLKLVCTEHVRSVNWPTGDRRTEPEGRSGEFRIPSAEDFVGRFHHLAFTYDEEQRTVWLDGQAVIRMKPLKTPAIASKVPKLLFANSHIAHPGVMSADLDELKIYSGVKYHHPFQPSAEAPQLREIPEEKASRTESREWKSGTPHLSGDGRRLVYPLERGAEKYSLELSCGDGLGLVLSPRDAVLNLHVDHQVDLPALVFETEDGNASAGALMLKKRDTRVQCSLEGNGSSLRFRVHLAKGGKSGKAYLEVRTVLRRHGSPWTRCFDGASVRSILRPFRPFAFDGLFLALPMAAAWNRSGGAALALAPESLCGWISRGMPEENAVGLTLRTVLRKEGEITFAFDLLSFDSVYGADDAVDRYHALHPAFFRLNPRINPDNYGNLAIQNVWKNAAYLSRAPHFSLRELTRRTRGSWAWFYYSGSSPGNWAADPELLNELAPINLRHLGDGYFHEGHTEKVAAECAALKKNAVSPALYVSSWADRRFTRYFSDSLFESADTYNGITSWPQYWGRNAFDHIMLAWGTSYGKHLLRQCGRLLKNNPDCDTFAFDLCGYDYQFRKTNSLGGLNAFDEHGEYLPQVTALAELLDAMRRLENAAGSQTAVVANADVSLAGFPTAFRVANTLHEQQRILTLQSVQQRRRQTRLMGERPTTFYCMPPLTGNYFTDEDPRLLRYAAVSEHQNHLLKGMLYNIRQNWEIFGVKESVEALDELLRTQSLGHRQTVGAKIEGRLEAVRYGEPHRGAIALVNSSPETQSATVTLDTAYYRAVPLVAAEGVRLDVENGVFQTDGIKPLSWRVVEFAGALPHPCAPRYSSTLSRTPDLTEISLTFKHPVLLKGMRIECRAGETLMLRLNGREISQIPDNAAAGDTLVIGFRNPIWLAPAREIISIPAEKETCIRLSGSGDGAENEIGRIAEFFRYHALMTGSKIRIEPHAQPDEAHIQVIAADAPAGITLRNGKVVLRGERRFLPRLTGEYLKALEVRYPLYGVFGTQQPTRPLDWAATPMQARFQKRHGLIGKTVSTQETASEFIRFLKEKGIQETQGF